LSIGDQPENVRPPHHKASGGESAAPASGAVATFVSPGSLEGRDGSARCDDCCRRLLADYMNDLLSFADEARKEKSFRRESLVNFLEKLQVMHLCLARTFRHLSWCREGISDPMRNKIERSQEEAGRFRISAARLLASGGGKEEPCVFGRNNPAPDRVVEQYRDCRAIPESTDPQETERRFIELAEMTDRFVGTMRTPV